MALVMLPCDLPWWSNVKEHLIRIGQIKEIEELIDEMEKIYELCNISLDPDDENPEPDLFEGFRTFLENDLNNEERRKFFQRTLPHMTRKALKLKDLKPTSGLHFSLQQQPDCTELNYDFVSALIANSFFSTFPKRTEKSHPTLRNFNFSNFFKTLNLPCQKSKLRSVFHYFDWLERKENCNGKMKIIRQVMSGREWLTIEDWLECSLPLCPVQIKHDGKLERAEADTLKICFSSSKIGESALTNGTNQESINFVTFPELLTILLNVESLEDNEVLTIENVRHVTRINDPKQKASLEKLEYPYTTSVCCMDADDYTKLPIGQYEEDNILRELNKCLLAFQQITTSNSLTDNNNFNEKSTFTKPNQRCSIGRRLSPIGESSSSSKLEKQKIPVITQESCSTTKSNDDSSSSSNNNNNKLKVESNHYPRKLPDLNSRRGRFIVLGSSGECLPVNRRPLETMRTIYSSCCSSDEEFHSAKSSFEESDDENNQHQKYSIDLDTSERRHRFAKNLKDVLKKNSKSSSESSSSSSSSYNVGISITGSEVRDKNIKVRREGSIGFALKEEALDENFLDNSLRQEKRWIDKFKSKHSSPNKRESNRSSEYSFSTEYSSELEEVYEQFSKWLEDPILETEKGTKRELDSRELAVVKFAGSLLKRTLSESFAGVPVPLAEEIQLNETKNSNRNKLVLNAKSLSLELAKHKHRLAAQLISQIARKSISDGSNNGLRSISTGNWGCGSARKGDVQIKVIIQWLAASVAGVPSLIYYTCGHQQMSKLDTVCRILVDRKWCVKDLAQAILRYSNQVLHGREISGNLFQELIGLDKNNSQISAKQSNAH